MSLVTDEPDELLEQVLEDERMVTIEELREQHKAADA